MSDNFWSEFRRIGRGYLIISLAGIALLVLLTIAHLIWFWTGHDFLITLALMVAGLSLAALVISAAKNKSD